MSKNINIGRKHDADLNYRYKMPRLTCKQESGGNGKKTLFTNWLEVSKALHREPSYLARFCQSELSANADFDEATAFCEFRGHLEQAALQELVHKFVDRYVLCAKCHLPETDIQVSEGVVWYQCNACGNRAKGAMNDRLTKYIAAHPPAGATTLNDDGEHEGLMGTIEIPEHWKNGTVEDGDDENWAADSSAAAAAAREAEALGSSKVLASMAVSSASLVAAPPALVVSADDPVSAIIDEVNMLRACLGTPKYAKDLAEMKPPKGVFACFVTLIDPVWENAQADLLATIPANAEVLLATATSDPSDAAKKSNFRMVIKSVERSIHLNPKRLPLVPKIFLALYEADLVPEEFWLEWDSKPPKKDKAGEIPKDFSLKIRAEAASFITWLKTAEAEE